jgi:cupin superfamily acireductone dioxygenase involved in methionine salvage
MADFGKIKGKGKNRFGDIPTPDETDNNLDAPEIAPADPSVEVKKSRNKTGRTVPFNTRVTAEFDKEFRTIAFTRGFKKVELLEVCLDAYKELNGIK